MFSHTQFDHHAKYCCCLSYYERAGMGGPKNLGMLEPRPQRWGRSWPPGNYTSSHHANFDHSRSNRSSVVIEICWKMFTFQVHWRSLESTRSIGHLWLLLVFHRTIDLSRTVFEIEGNICKSFPIPVHLTLRWGLL